MNINSNKKQRLTMDCEEASTSSRTINVPTIPDFNAEDRLLKLWQDQQMAKSIEDNTINRVLESYIMFFQHDHRQLEQAAAAEQVEDQAVLMAIGMHGLQEQQQQQNEADNNELSAELNELHEQLFNNPSPEPPQPPAAEAFVDTTHNDFMEAAVLSAIQKKGIGLTR